ncbi:MAG: radical SAM protein [Candidatus Hydrogenedentes bacterium]|nr:radical SAM protein [Candidatus Hydrogenedentota bacterium]
MRVAVLNPMFGKDFTKSARWFARSRGRVQRHPDYLATAAAVIEQAGHQLLFMDCQAKNMPTAEVIQNHLKAFKPDMVVYQATTPSIYADIEAARLCKEAVGGMHVMVGPHVSAEPESTLRASKGVLDAVARHEFDYILRDLANGVLIKDCRGASWMDGEVYRENPDMPYIENLDDLPFPAWHHLDMRDYKDGAKLFPFVTAITGRGCRYRCSYCQIPQVMNGHNYRTHSVERVVDEMAYDKKIIPGLQEVMFEDDTLTMRIARERLIALCEEILRRDLKLSWSANARVDLNDLETLQLMKRSGCRMLCVGFEFGDQKILNNVKKGTTVDQMYTFAENAAKAKLRIHGCFMVGGPGETRETAMSTVKMSRELPIDTAQFTGVVAYPGTSYYAWAEKEGALIPKDWRDWVTDDYEQAATVDLPTLSRHEIDEIVDVGLRGFYLRPRQMWRMLRNISSWSDVKAKYHGLMSFMGYFGTNGRKNFVGFTGNN